MIEEVGVTRDVELTALQTANDEYLMPWPFALRIIAATWHVRWKNRADRYVVMAHFAHA